MFSSPDQNLSSHDNQAQSLDKSTSPWLSVKAGLLYFVSVFGVGCILGLIRLLWLAPQFGTRMAELLEMPLMLVVIIAAAHWVIQRLALPAALWPRLTMGLVALGCLLCAEWGLVLRLRGLSMVDYIATRDPVSGTSYYIVLCLFAVMPWLISPQKAP